MVNLYSELSSGASSGKNTFHQWRHLWEQSKPSGLVSILQLCVDMTGYAYDLNQEDLFLLDENVNVLLKNKILEAPFELRNFLLGDTYIVNLQEFLKHLIVRPWQELLADNEWLNKMVKLILAFCTSKIDVCVMVGTSFASIMLLHLCKAQHNAKQALQRPSAFFRDNEQRDLLERIHRNVQNICMVMLINIRPGFKFAQISGLLTDHVCGVLDSFPFLLIEEYNQLDLLDNILTLKNKKAVQSVLKFLKNHFTNSICSTITSEVSLYILSTDKTFIRVMDTFKLFEPSVIQLFYHACSVTGKKLTDETCERITTRMFSTDEATVSAAIELISLHYTGNAQVGDAEAGTILAMVGSFGRYEYPLSALEAILDKFWQKGFILQFNDLFLLLKDTLELENRSFSAKTIVHIISYCHQLLMADITAKISPSQEGSNPACWASIKMRIESFVSCYPKCLAEVSENTDLYNLLLNCLNPEHKDLYSVAGVDCQHYYVNVIYNTLSPVAMHAKDYSILLRTLSSIYRFDTIIHISEDIWKELTDDYFTVFFHIRSRLRTYNLAVDRNLMEAYTTSMTRLCVLVEITNASENVLTLADYLANDLRLLERMKLSDEANALFYRLYKNTLYACVQYALQHNNNQRYKKNSAQRAKQVKTFMTALCAQLDAKEDHTIDVGRHIVVTLCDMFLLTQPGKPNTVLTGMQPTEFTVERDVLEKLAKYVERFVFIGDVEANVLSAKKRLLVSYNKLYSGHSALPRLTDTRHIIKHYGVSTAFTAELVELMSIIYSKSADDFYEIVTKELFEYCQKKGCFYKSKAFIKNLQSFYTKHLDCMVVADDYYFSVVHRIMNALLEEYFDSNEVAKNATCKLLEFLQPWVKQMSKDTKRKLNREIRHNQKYATNAGDLNDVIVKMIKKFLNYLKT